VLNWSSIACLPSSSLALESPLRVHVANNASILSHKRSRSGLAKSLLHRDKSKNLLVDPDGNESSIAGSDAGSEPPSPTLSAPATHHSHGGLRSSRHKAKSSSGVATMMESPSNAALNRDATAKVQDAPGPTIQQSVRMFKLFEVLRSGDNAAIAKAVTETSTMPTISEGAESASASGTLEGTTILHLAIQCADPAVVEQILAVAKNTPGASIDVNARDRDGNTPLHLASQLARPTTVRLLLDQRDINDSLLNYQGRSALDLARTPDIFQQLQLSRSLFVDTSVKEIQKLVAKQDYDQLEKTLEDSRVENVIDVNGGELATDPGTMQSGGTLLHEAARKKDTKLIQLLLLHGADPFRRDRKGKLPQDVTKDDKTRSILKKSPAAAAAQRGIQEKAVLGSGEATDGAPGGKDSREMKGYLKKWTNYTSGWKLRWFVLEDGVMSYYKHQGILKRQWRMKSAADNSCRRCWICMPWCNQYANCQTVYGSPRQDQIRNTGEIICQVPLESQPRCRSEKMVLGPEQRHSVDERRSKSHGTAKAAQRGDTPSSQSRKLATRKRDKYSRCF